MAKEKKETSNIVILAARTPQGKMYLMAAALSMVITLVIVYLGNHMGHTAVGAYLKTHNIFLILNGFLSMASIEQFSLVANAIRMQQEEESKRSGK